MIIIGLIWWYVYVNRMAAGEIPEDWGRSLCVYNCPRCNWINWRGERRRRSGRVCMGTGKLIIWSYKCQVDRTRGDSNSKWYIAYLSFVQINVNAKSMDKICLQSLFSGDDHYADLDDPPILLYGGLLNLEAIDLHLKDHLQLHSHLFSSGIKYILFFQYRK